MTGGHCCVESSSIIDAATSKRFIEEDDTEIITVAFSSTSRFVCLRKFMVALAGRLVVIRCSATTGGAMRMGMISKGCEKTLSVFPDTQIGPLFFGNLFSDMRFAAIK